MKMEGKHMSYNYTIINGELYHWGIKGMKWGVRRYQNKDGSLTAHGKKRYKGDTALLKTKSKHRLKLEAQYRQKGMSEEQAEAAAKKRIRIEKTIAAVTGMTLAAATAIAVKKYRENQAAILRAATAEVEVVEWGPWFMDYDGE
jgi:hypothetical protein